VVHKALNNLFMNLKPTNCNWGTRIKRVTFRWILLALGMLYAILGYRALSSNISNDDAGFIYTAASGNINDWLQAFVNYVPGRNLHILWNVILFSFIGSAESSFWVYHFIQGITYFAISVIAYRVQRQAGVKQNIAIFFSLLSLFCPAFSSILLWATSLPQHLFSTLFLLTGLHLILIDKTRSPLSINPFLRIFLITIFLSLAMFTYDQAAAVVLFVTLLLTIQKLFNSRHLRNVFYGGNFSYFSLLALSCLYLAIFFEGRGTGNSLTVGGGTFQRLSSNLLIPVNVLKKIHAHSDSAKSYFYFNPTLIFFFSIFVGIAIFYLLLRSTILNPKNPSLDSKISLKIGVLFLSFSLASYIPAAVWYVSPRHLYLPIALGMIGVSMVISFIYDQSVLNNFVHIALRMVSVLALALSIFAFNSQISAWLERDEFRSQLYMGLENYMKENRLDCILVDSSLNEQDPYLYSEVPNYALDYYNKRPIGGDSKCEFSPTKSSPMEFACNPENRETWNLLTGYSSRRDSVMKFKFATEPICKP